MIRWLRRKGILPDDGLDDLSAEQASRLASEAYRREREPQLRREEKRLGTPNWETLSFDEMQLRWLARYEESKRPRLEREARSLGVPFDASTRTETLKWAVLHEQVRRNNIRDVRRAGKRGGS